MQGDTTPSAYPSMSRRAPQKHQRKAPYTDAARCQMIYENRLQPFCGDYSFSVLLG